MFQFNYLFNNKTYKERKFKELYDKYWYFLNPEDTNIYNLEHLKIFLNDVITTREIDFFENYIEIYDEQEELFFVIEENSNSLYKYIMAYGNSTIIKLITNNGR